MLFSDLALNVRNDVGPTYAPYGPNDKGVKRNRSPVPQADYYKHTGQSQGVYLPPKTDTGRHENRRAVLWYNPAKYGTTPHQGWPMTNNIVNNRYPLPQSVSAPHILHLNTDHQQPPPPQLVKQVPTAPPQKSGAISIEKIGENMRAKLPAQQQDFTIHRRIGQPQPQGQPPPEFPNAPYHASHIRYD